MNTDERQLPRQQAIQAECLSRFSLRLSVHALLFEDMPVSEVASTTIFTTTDHRVYALCESDGILRLGDVQHHLKQAGFILASYVAPHGNPRYFEKEAYTIFINAYPGRRTWTNEEKAYYQLLVPYAPALVLIAGVQDCIKRYNQYSGKWQEVYELPASLKARCYQARSRQ